VLVVALTITLAAPAAAGAAPNWVSGPATVSASSGVGPTPKLASNARGDTVVAWVDPATGKVFSAERPAGGTFTVGAAVSNDTDLAFGSVAIDGSGNEYVFYIANNSTTTTAKPRVAIKALGAATWPTPTDLTTPNSTFPPQSAIAGAVSPSGKAVAVWYHGNINNATTGKLDFAVKAAGQNLWSAKAEMPGFSANSPGPLSLAMNANGQAALAFSRQGCSGFSQRADGSTMSAANVWATAGPVQTCDNGGNGVTSPPVAAIAPNGTATAAWGRINVIQFQTAQAGSAFAAAPASGANDLSGAGATGASITVADDGTTTVGWVDAGGVKARTRPAAGGTFGAAQALPNTLTSPSGPVLLSGGDGSTIAVWSGVSGVNPVLGAARRPTAGGAFAALPNGPGTGNANVVAGGDDEGNASVAWTHTAGGQSSVQATGIDAAGPTISGVTFPATGDALKPFTYGATLADRWSTPTGQWSFGDGTTGAVDGSKTYAAGGTFTATLTATDAVGNASTATRSITVAPKKPGGGGGGGGSHPDVVAPTLSATSLTNKTFAVNRKGKAEKAVAAAAKRGTTIRFTLSEAAKVRVLIESATSGRKVGKTCAKPTRKNRKAKRCTRYRRSGAFDVAGTKGANRHAFSGRIGAKSLKPGRYRATLTATDAAGNRSAAKRLSFKVVKR
jgi:hypothetical protein